MSVKVKFKIGEKKGITANYTVNNNNPIRTVFKINAASASFYSLTGSPYDNANLKDALDAKADKSELDADMAAVDESISNVQTVIENNYNTLDSKIDNVNSDLSGDISTLENTVNNRIDATNQTVADLSTTVADNNTAINNRVDGIVDSFDGDISALGTAIQNEAATRANNDTLLQGDINTLRNDLTSEISNRTSADNTLQDNIDNIQNTIDNYGDIISYNASDFATAAQGELAESALQPNDNISGLNNDAGYLTDADLSGYLRNTATSAGSLTIVGDSSSYGSTINIGENSRVGAQQAIAIGYLAKAWSTKSTALGTRSVADGNYSTALGYSAQTYMANSAIQLGYGENSTANTLNIGFYNNDTTHYNWQLLNGTTGLIPDARLSNNIARSSDIPTFTDAQIAALNSGATTANIEQIATNTSNISSLSNTVTSNYNTLDGRITSEVNTLNGAITTEATNRQNADNALQSQIDAITSASDVFDIVGTYAELQAYDIASVPPSDIIKVLVDSTHNNAATYYRCVENDGVKSWTYIGSEGAYYTKSESDNIFVAKTTTINNKPLSNNITLTANDVNALPADTVIGSGIITLQKNGVDIDSFNVNATANKSINISVPTDTGDLTNNAGYIKVINSTNVINALGYTPYNASNPAGFITSADLPTNLVTTDTVQDISGRKTFLGEKAIYFKQVATSNKLGFTLYNPSNTELAALEYRPNTISGASLLALNCPQTTGGYVGFRYWGTPAVNIVAPKVATAGNYFMATHITNGTLTVTADNTGTVNISTLLPDVSNFVTNTSLATTLQDYVLSSDLSTTLTNYVTSTNLTTILTNYALTSQIPTVGNGTVTINQGGNQKGTFTLNQSGNVTIDLDASEIFIAEYGTTTFAEVQAAYENNKKILLRINNVNNDTGEIKYAELTNITILSYPVSFYFDSVDGNYIERYLLEMNDTWSSQLFIAASQTSLDSKVNVSDIWYDSSSSTLNIGVAQS